MKLYLAGADKWEKGQNCTEGNVLVSYHLTGKKRGKITGIPDPEKRIQVENVFLDCGRTVHGHKEYQ